MKNRPHILLFFLISLTGLSQNNTFSPYSRYGLGELNQTTFAHNAAMGGAYIALKPDSTMPIFINAGNPAAYALIRLTSLEVGGSGLYSNFLSKNTSLTKWSTNFAYGALGFPVARNGGACFGIMPFSNVGYDLQSSANQTNIGNVLYEYSGTGGLNKAFLGYGIMPFRHRLSTFRRNKVYVPDSLGRLTGYKYHVADLGNKLLSDLSVGFNANYIFGSIDNTAQVVYPNSVLYNNTYRDRQFTMGAFTGNFGLQTAVTIDSVYAKRKRSSKAVNHSIDSLSRLGIYSDLVLKEKTDSIRHRYQHLKRALTEKVKFTFGYFVGLNNALNASYSSTIYNYVLDGSGNSIARDTVLYNGNKSGTVKLPLEQGFGIGFKKGERINLVADFAITNWQNFKYFDEVSTFKNNYRVAAGINYVPDKYAAGSGAFFKRMSYRFGLSYQTGYINLKNTLISNYALTAGLGIPVGIGRLSSMVNLSVQLGQTGTTANGLIQENYLRFNFGFTFSDRWFQKFRYD